MQTSAAGNKHRRPVGGASGHGFTLLELLVVLVIVALGSAAVVLGMRDSRDAALEQEAHRLVALLEAARAQSRAMGVPWVWRSVPGGFVIGPAGTVGTESVQPWLTSVQVLPNNAVLQLGPEPVIGAQSLTLRSPAPSPRGWIISTQGIAPFSLRADAQGVPP